MTVRADPTGAAPSPEVEPPGRRADAATSWSALLVGGSLSLSGLASYRQFYLFTIIALIWIAVGPPIRFRRGPVLALLALLGYCAFTIARLPDANFRPLVGPAVHAVLGLLVVAKLATGRSGVSVAFTRGFLYGAATSAVFALLQRQSGMVNRLSVVTVYDRSNPNRFAGLSFHPNQLSLFCAFGLIVLLVRPGIVQRWRYTTAGFLALGLLIGASRTSLVLVATAGSVVLLRALIRTIRRPRVVPRVLVGTIAAVFAVLLAGQTTDWYLLRRLTEDSGNTGDDLRARFVDTALEQVGQNPLLGSGFPERLYHNAYLSIAAGIGVIGVLLWLHFVWRIMWDYSEPPRFDLFVAVAGLAVAMTTTQEIHLVLPYLAVVPFMPVAGTHHPVSDDQQTRASFETDAHQTDEARRSVRPRTSDGRDW